jgi:demethylmenaquinone methyltransferase / 2-methoxy-6-polyprenyl-1,4-benzoquinol methylase
LLDRGFRVTGLDQSTEMLARARTRFGDGVPLVEASADALPFPAASFDHLTFTYLLRYVEDPGATMAELARVVRPGGAIAMLEFGVPRGIWRRPWNVWVDIGLPATGRLLSPGWHDVGRFLGPSIRNFHERYPEPRLLELWRAAGIGDVRFQRPSLGGGLLVWGRRNG